VGLCFDSFWPQQTFVAHILISLSGLQKFPSFV
jgi:hypothetical protein